jgi:hypothetical protein
MHSQGVMGIDLQTEEEPDRRFVRHSILQQAM